MRFPRGLPKLFENRTKIVHGHSCAWVWWRRLILPNCKRPRIRVLPTV
eukprot:SAG31_NODE_827_length_11749_cov_14.363090_9_plen_48_part_00